MAIPLVGIGFYFSVNVLIRIIYGKALVTQLCSLLAPGVILMGILAGVAVKLRGMGISEESASASTEIHTEIVNIRGYVRDVAELVDGNQAAPQKPSTMSNRPQREMMAEDNAIAL